jgi:hypothetical protein
VRTEVLVVVVVVGAIIAVAIAVINPVLKNF